MHMRLQQLRLGNKKFNVHKTIELANTIPCDGRSSHIDSQLSSRMAGQLYIE